MNDALTLQGFLGRLNVRQMLAPLLIILILSMMVLPLPPFVLDVFFTFNIAVSVMVLLVAMIGAIVLTLRTRPGLRRQSIAAQLARTRADTLVMTHVAVGSAMTRVAPLPAPEPEPAHADAHGDAHGGHHGHGGHH